MVLLTATAAGLASCPVTEPLEIAETRRAVRRDVFGTSGYPQMLLRVGWAPINADPLPSTPRRFLDDTVEWVIAGDCRGDVADVAAGPDPVVVSLRQKRCAPAQYGAAVRGRSDLEGAAGLVGAPTQVG